MKKTFLTIIAIIAILFAFSSCDELLNSLANSEEQDQTKTEQKNDDNDSTDTGNEEGNGEGGEETESEKSGIDGMVGKLFYQQTKSKKQIGDGRYLYFESSTKVTQFLDDIASTGQFIPVITKSASIKDNVLEFSYTEDDWYYNQVNPLKLVFIDNVIIAYSEVQDTIYTKTSDGEGLYGSWEYIDKNENIRTFIIDETKAGTEEEEMYEYTNENGLIMYGEGWDSGCCYYDGKNL